MAKQKILLGTTNVGKIKSFKLILDKLGYEGVSFADLGISLEEPEETMPTAKEIAAEKALGYAKQFADLPVLARDDTNVFLGVDEEDDPKNHNKAFVAQRAGEYTEAKAEIVFAEVAHKYGGKVPIRLDWGYGLAWHEGDDIKVISTLASTNPDDVYLTDEICEKKFPGFCFAAIMKVRTKAGWKYDSELTEEEHWETYWNYQKNAIESLLKQYNK